MNTQKNERPVCIIYRNDFDEFEVPEKNGERYYTDDRDDAIATACYIYGADVVIRYRRTH